MTLKMTMILNNNPNGKHPNDPDDVVNDTVDVTEVDDIENDDDNEPDKYIVI